MSAYFAREAFEEMVRQMNQGRRQDFREAQIEALRETMRQMLAQRRRDVIWGVYREMGFELDTRGVLNAMPFIEVNATVATVDGDFYVR